VLPRDQHARLTMAPLDPRGWAARAVAVRLVAASHQSALDVLRHSGHSMGQAVQNAPANMLALVIVMLLVVVDRSAGDDVSLAGRCGALASRSLSGFVLGHAESVSGRSHALGRQIGTTDGCTSRRPLSSSPLSAWGTASSEAGRCCCLM